MSFLVRVRFPSVWSWLALRKIILRKEISHHEFVISDNFRFPPCNLRRTDIYFQKRIDFR
jgi:hypothetical protein